jgi:hypothetical protein
MKISINEAFVDAEISENHTELKTESEVGSNDEHCIFRGIIKPIYWYKRMRLRCMDIKKWNTILRGNIQIKHTRM